MTIGVSIFYGRLPSELTYMMTRFTTQPFLPRQSPKENLLSHITKNGYNKMIQHS